MCATDLACRVSWENKEVMGYGSMLQDGWHPFLHYMDIHIISLVWISLFHPPCLESGLAQFDLLD